MAFDGGGAKGLITAMVLDKMELYAYEYAKKQGYEIKTFKNADGDLQSDRIHMSQLFDMLAGTSTGSIISSALTYPNPATLSQAKPDPYYYANTMIYLYSEKGNVIFQSGEIDYVIVAIVAVIATGFFTAGGYLRGKHCYDNDRMLAEFDQIKETLDNTISKAEDGSEDLNFS